MQRFSLAVVGAGRRALGCRVLLALGRRRRHGVLRHAQHRPAKQAVTREIERIDFDARILSRMDETDVAVGQHGLDLDGGVIRHNNGERLGRRHHAADRMNRQLLHHAIDRRRQPLQLRAPLRPDNVMREAGG